MPRLVADSNHWHCSAAMVCVGQSEQPRALEWELRSGFSLALIDTGARAQYESSTQDKTDEGDRTGSFCHPRLLRSKSRRASPPPPLSDFITSEQIKNFGASAPVPSPCQNWSPDSHRGSRLHFEWIAAGFTAVCFWNAACPLIMWLEGRVWFGFIQALPGPIESE
jgi:hypothetical protein